MNLKKNKIHKIQVLDLCVRKLRVSHNWESSIKLLTPTNSVFREQLQVLVGHTYRSKLRFHVA